MKLSLFTVTGCLLLALSSAATSLAQENNPLRPRSVTFEQPDGKQLEILIDNNSIRALADGKVVHVEHLQQEEGRIVITDDSGAVMACVDFQPDTEKFETTPALSGQMRLGIQVDLPDESLATHLELINEDCLLILEVDPQLPAAEAGVQKYDVVVQINGETPATQELLHTTLADAEPGETIELAIKRHAIDLVIEVAPTLVTEVAANEATALVDLLAFRPALRSLYSDEDGVFHVLEYPTKSRFLGTEAFRSLPLQAWKPTEFQTYPAGTLETVEFAAAEVLSAEELPAAEPCEDVPLPAGSAIVAEEEAEPPWKEIERRLQRIEQLLEKWAAPAKKQAQ